MTAVNVFVREDSVHVVTDGLAGSWAKPNALVSKVEIVPHLNAVLAGRGKAFALRDVWSFIAGRYLTFDAARAGIQKGDLRAHRRFLRAIIPNWPEFQLVVAGISDATGKPSAFSYFSKQNGPFAAWTVNDIPWFFSAPDVRPAEAAARARRDMEVLAYIAVIDAQREYSRAGKEKGFLAGGFAQVTTIQRQGIEAPFSCRITTQILKRYPDDLEALR